MNMDEGYMYIHISVVLVLFTVLISIFIYGIGLFIKGYWPHLDVRMGVFYSIIVMMWVGLGFLLTR